ATVLDVPPMREHVLLLVSLTVLASAPGCGPSDSGTQNPEQAAPVANPAAPPASPSPVIGNLRVTNIDIGRSVTPDNTMHDASLLFIPSDKVWSSIEIEGTAPHAVIQARWFGDKGNLLQQETQEITPTGRSVVAFHVEPNGTWP